MLKNILVSKRIESLCLKFANSVYNTNFDEYNRRNQKDKNKIILDITIGKIAEFAVFNYMYSQGYFVTYPDLRVYEKEKKSFDSDLYVIKDGLTFRMHVKSQKLNMSKQFGESWSFQNNDPLIIKPTNKDYIALCIVDNLNVKINDIVKANKILGKYSDPKKKSLTTKKVLYFNDI